MIPGMPDWGEGWSRSVVGILAASFRHLLSILSLTIFSPLFKDSHLNYSRMPVILPVS